MMKSYKHKRRAINLFSRPLNEKKEHVGLCEIHV